MESVHHLMGLGEDFGGRLCVGRREIHGDALDLVPERLRDGLAQGMCGGLGGAPRDDLKDAARRMGVNDRGKIHPLPEGLFVNPQQNMRVRFCLAPLQCHTDGPFPKTTSLFPADAQQSAGARQIHGLLQNLDRMVRKPLREMRTAPLPRCAQSPHPMLRATASRQPAMDEQRNQANIQMPPHALTGPIISRRGRAANRACQRHIRRMLHPNIYLLETWRRLYPRDQPRRLNAKQPRIMFLKRTSALCGLPILFHAYTLPYLPRLPLPTHSL